MAIMHSLESQPKERIFQVKRSRAGLGLFASKAIAKGTFIVEYVGEIISSQEADRRGGKYLFQLNSRKTVDGKNRSNVARYINHSCRPNAEVEIKRGHILIFAKKKIREGEEIAYDYGKEYFQEYIEPYGCRCEFCLKKRDS
ncbi:MAG TPA: SET domain-containing protein [Candidatus Paceibacterota bacterium]|nr:SET domain-containing protein [Candidatus Paceibacterota bacterium]